MGVKPAGAGGLQPYHHHVPIVLKSGSLNLLETSGPVQAFNEIALPLLLRSFGYLLNVILLLVSGLTIFMTGLGANFEYNLKKIIALFTLRLLGLMIMIN